MSHILWRRIALSIMAGVLLAGGLGACTTTTSSDRESRMSQREQLDQDVQQTLDRLYRSVPASRALADRAEGVLVFPGVLGASFIVGASHGDGSLLVDGAKAGYYTTTSGSIGFQAGAQSQAVIYMLMTEKALNRVRSDNGWSIGASAGVAVADIGANGQITNDTANQEAVAFVMNNQGIQGGVSLNGAKISKASP
ncbi:lipid-binding SYLF domain-containing protein [Salinicola sp. LHM]|jgi:lipid-binding SYLF domain-containing protein|uniref:BPSL1445 family SYLF domain-containing lipoprotein n=1 Tax=Salinicola TaxID=404432 RepID=UPI000DA1E6C9|nr:MULTISPECIES: lipid-binding SYLF domain-containing protein [Salinicola]WQH32272.1 lipid-binding SYLF domain-containing protein [Salinicola sp. LHM]